MSTQAIPMAAVTAAIKQLHPFINPQQMRVMADACRGEEGDWFKAKFLELQALIASMPKTYEQDGKGDQAVISLHYFTGGCDWWITEKDAETPDQPGQHQAFGLADLGYGAELGYISIIELLENGAELDLHFAPRTIAKLKQGKCEHASMVETGDPHCAWKCADCGYVYGQDEQRKIIEQKETAALAQLMEAGL